MLERGGGVINIGLSFQPCAGAREEEEQLILGNCFIHVLEKEKKEEQVFKSIVMLMGNKGKICIFLSHIPPLPVAIHNTATATIASDGLPQPHATTPHNLGW